MKKIICHANVFDGFSEKLKENQSIIIEDNKVLEITARQPENLEAFDEVIDAKGRVVIPGLTDAHAHPGIPAPYTELAHMRTDEIAVRSARHAYEMLMRGFTTLRDAGGLTYGLKQSIDKGWVPGPRIFPSHAGISQTAGAADFRDNTAQEHKYFGSTSTYMNTGSWIVADGVPEVLKATRQQLFLGASQIKIIGSGSFSSFIDPVMVNEWTLEEIKACVAAAKDYGTYVFSHVYSDESVRRAVEGGVMCIEHGQLMGEETARMMADKGVWLCPCPQFRFRDDYKMKTPPKSIASKQKVTNIYRDMMQQGEVLQDELVEKYKIRIVYGTDLIGSETIEELLEGGQRQLTPLHGYKLRYGSLEGLRSATGNIHDLLKLSTFRNPYPDGKIGVLEEGSFADLIIVEGNPVEDLDVLTEVSNIKLVMKDGIVYKNIL